MSYRLEFHPLALKEWRKLDRLAKSQFKTKLEKLLDEPRIPANRLRGGRERYKIKLHHAGLRLVYEIVDDRLVIVVIAIAKRDKLRVYALAEMR